jgi:hypothetical protein
MTLQNKNVLIALMAVTLCSRGARGQEADSGEKERGGLVETTVSKDFNYGLFFLPVGKGVSLDAQYYWGKERGSQSLAGIAYKVKFNGLHLSPGLYFVSETCHPKGVKPWGCTDVAVALGWEWESRGWGGRGFLAQTLRKSELRFGFVDPAQLYRRFHGGKTEMGIAFIGEEEKEDEKTRLLGKGGIFARHYYGKHNAEGVGRSYAEAAILSGHGGPTVRLTFGRIF